jgi:hypothetical protein
VNTTYEKYFEAKKKMLLHNENHFLFIFIRSEDETSLQSSMNDESQKSHHKMSATTPTHSLTPESSLSNLVNNKSLNYQDISNSFANPEATFVV